MTADYRFTEDELAFLLAHFDETLLGVDDAGCIAFGSARLRELVGYEPESVIGTALLDLVNLADHDTITSLLASGTAGEPRVVRFVRSGGELIETVVKLQPGSVIGSPAGSLLTLVPARPFEALEQELTRHLAREDHLTRLATMFVRLPSDQFDAGIQAALAELGTFDNIGRVSIWRPVEGRSLARTHYWQAAGDDGEPGCRRIPIGDHWLTDVMAAPLEVGIDDIDQAVPETEPVAAVMRAMDTFTSLSVSLLADDSFAGFLSFEGLGRPMTFGYEQRATLRSAAGILSEVFARRTAEQLLDHQARHDPLTGLTNRWACLDDLAAALAALDPADTSGFGGSAAPLLTVDDSDAAGLAIALVDIDRFKVLNDWLGHSAGDLVLVAIAERLRLAVGDRGRLNRLGGDELLIVMNGLARERDAVELSHDLQEALLEPFDIGGQPVYVTVSIGIARVSDRGGSAEADINPGELVQRADAAMYRAKQQGRNRIEVFDHAQQRAAEERLAIRSELRSASARGELEVHYQPELAVDGGALVAVEAFARWNHPRHGLIDAGRFLTLADQDGVVRLIGARVLDEACGQAAAWRAGGFEDLVVGVNLSDAEVFSGDLVHRVRGSLEAAGLPAHGLRLDIEENTLMSDPSAALDVLAGLRALGVQVAIDGFGTGNTSLAFLRRFRVDAVRMSPVQVAGIESDPDAAIVRGIVRLAATFGLSVVAVGVETPGQHEAARRLGCDRVQGFLLGRPEPADRLRLGPATSPGSG